MRGPDLLVELIGERADVLLKIIESPFRIVEGIRAAIETKFIIRGLVLNHDSPGRLGAGVRGFPGRHVIAGGDAALHDPIAVELEGTEYSPLAVRIKTVEERVTRHQVVRRQLGFDVSFRNNAPNGDVQALRNEG